MEKEKIALLDTDFVSKAYRSCADSERLIEKVIDLPEYKFYCHQQIPTELERRFADADAWLAAKFKDGSITCYSDADVLNELKKYYSESSYWVYSQFLKTACDAYSKDMFTNHYKPLSEISPEDVTQESFLAALCEGDESVGRGNDLGEIKTAVLLQTLSRLRGESIHMFYSDDQNARKGMIQFDDVSCRSVLSTFVQLKNEGVITKEEAKPLYDSYLATLAPTQKTFAVVEADPVGRHQKVAFEDVFQDIFDDKFHILPIGMLRYKTEKQPKDTASD